MAMQMRMEEEQEQLEMEERALMRRKAAKEV